MAFSKALAEHTDLIATLQRLYTDSNNYFSSFSQRDDQEKKNLRGFASVKIKIDGVVHRHSPFSLVDLNIEAEVSSRLIPVERYPQKISPVYDR